MSTYSSKSWLDPSKNTVAQNKGMELSRVKPVLLVGTDGEPYNSSSGGGSGSTSVVSSVASSTSSVELLASASGRIEGVIQNDSTAVLYVKFGTAATSSSFTISLDPQEAVVIDKYNGVVHGTWASVNGNARVTVITS
tara:strand:+ start:4738 stop:5151 length:414 start_codon:yes stop_codon:yes gene_type:complete